MAVSDWSTTPSSNNAAPPNGWPENQAPSSLNDTGRQMMADIRAFYDNAALLDAANTYTNAELQTAIISPSALPSGETNDWAPTGFASARVIRITPNASGSTITGIAGGASGRRVTLINLGTTNVFIDDQNTSSTAANRFAAGSTTTITSGTGVDIWYDSVLTRWIVIP